MSSVPPAPPVSPVPDRDQLSGEYHRLLPDLERALRKLQERVDSLAVTAGLSVTFKRRVKSFDSCYAKILRRNPRPAELYHLTDLLGLRVICPFMEDQGRVEGLLEEAFSILERESKGEKLSYREFGYDSIHYLIDLPEDLAVPPSSPGGQPVVEVQVRTILQDAWAEVEHELIYKADFTPYDEPLKRKLAALNANLTLSDIMFQEIRDYQRQLHQQLQTRRELFFEQLKRQTAELLPGEDDAGGEGEEEREEGSAQDLREAKPATIDDLLLQGLYAHNRGDFQQAQAVYAAILERNPSPEVQAVIYIHRGMAGFSTGDYGRALEDFERGISLEPHNEKPYYYRGVIRMTTGNPEGAVRDFSASLERNPYQFSPLFSRAQAFYRLGSTARALEDCDAALKIKPDSRQAQRFRRRVLQQMEEA